MSNFITTFLIALGLSMDAFSLAILYGTNKLASKQITKLSAIVGLYHFCMPLIGLFFGNFILKFIPVSINFVVFVIFLFLAIQMISETILIKDSSCKKFNKCFWLFGFSVSVDSFSTGIGLELINKNHLLACLTFAMTSFAFTYIGLKFGNKLGLKFGKVATCIGGVILFLLGMYYWLFK